MLNASARLVSGMHTYDQGLAKLLHADLRWLDVADWVRTTCHGHLVPVYRYKVAMTVHRCLHDKEPKYLRDCCDAVSDTAVISDYTQNIVASYMYCAIHAIHSDGGHSLLLDQLCGT